MRMRALLAALAITATALPALAQTANIGALSERGNGVVIEGEVTAVFGNKFVVDDGSGRILAETGPHWYHRIDVRNGDTVRVTGEPDRGDTFDAFSIRYEDGRVQDIRPAYGPPPWAGGPRRARPAG